ncbi:MAG: tryptophan--tRNA ligase [Elusimicrobia bacterium]|nr:tryptophan--tRNA ligase [Elusimicrobiota bacterium]
MTQTSKKRVLSGMRPTGRLHIGHYFGALKNWVELQDNYDCFYMVADWHALTTDFADTSKIAQNSKEMLIDWLTAGLDPERSVIFCQSRVAEHSELFLILSMLAPLGWLYRCPTYKEQITEIQNKDLHNYGFLGYPILQTSDIVLYGASFVPVGQDQLPHLEFSRELTRRFNNFYASGQEGSEILIEPQALLTQTPKVPGTDSRKMSKSYGNSILIADTPDNVKAKVQSMFTDPSRIKASDPGHPEGCAVFAFHKIFNTDAATREQECEAGSIGCVACKKQLIEMLVAFMEPFIKKREEISKDGAYLEKVLTRGNEKAKDVAADTMKRIRQALKF